MELLVNKDFEGEEEKDDEEYKNEDKDDLKFLTIIDEEYDDVPIVIFLLF